MEITITEPGPLIAAGLFGAIGILIGLCVLILGIVWFFRRGSRGVALALLALALLPAPLAVVSGGIGEIGALTMVMKLRPAFTPADWAAHERQVVAQNWAAAIGVTLGLLGAAAALARSRDVAGHVD